MLSEIPPPNSNRIPDGTTPSNRKLFPQLRTDNASLAEFARATSGCMCFC